MQLLSESTKNTEDDKGKPLSLIYKQFFEMLYVNGRVWFSVFIMRVFYSS